MNVLPKRAHPMRIIAFPLARIKASRDAKMEPLSDSDTTTMLVYYHFDLHSPCGGREGFSWHNKILKNVMNKAVDLWTGLGKAPEGSWKLWTYELGERIADRIEFEELVLRSVDPSLGPTVPLTGTNEQVDEIGKNRRQLHSLPKIPLFYPPSVYRACLAIGENAFHPPFAHLRTLLASREPRHRRGFYLWMLIAPLTVPITLIPLIPNLPLFFCVWRSWSHYRAYRSSQYLSSLLDHGLIEPNPSLELDKSYASLASSSRISQNFPPPVPASGSSEKDSTFGNAAADRKSEPASRMGASQSERILLTREAMSHVLKTFGLPESAVVNIDRAMDQAHGRLKASTSSDPLRGRQVKNTLSMFCNRRR